MEGHRKGIGMRGLALPLVCREAGILIVVWKLNFSKADKYLSLIPVSNMSHPPSFLDPEYPEARH